MTEYTVTINGLESGLAKAAIEGMFEGQFPHADDIEVSKE